MGVVKLKGQFLRERNNHCRLRKRRTRSAKRYEKILWKKTQAFRRWSSSGYNTK